MPRRVYIGSTEALDTLEIVDLDTHPDGELLRWINEASRIRDAAETPRAATPEEYKRVYGWDGFYLVQLDECIRCREPQTRFGLHSKALWAYEAYPAGPLLLPPLDNVVALLQDELAVGGGVMRNIGNELPTTLRIKGTRPEVRRAIEELDTAAAIMVQLSLRVPDDEIQTEWLRFFGRSIERITESLEERAP